MVALPLICSAALALAAPEPGILGLGEAVATAERALGARGFDAERDGAVYEIDLVKDGQPVRAVVDVRSGKLLPDRRWKLPIPRLGRRAVNEVQSSPRTLSDLIAWVEGATRGEAVEVELERVGGRFVFRMELVGAPDEEVRVDLRSGAITPVIDD